MSRLGKTEYVENMFYHKQYHFHHQPRPVGIIYHSIFRAPSLFMVPKNVAKVDHPSVYSHVKQSKEVF